MRQYPDLLKIQKIENLRIFISGMTLHYKKCHGEKRSADLEAALEWLEKRWPELREKYGHDDIFNCDETAVSFYH